MDKINKTDAAWQAELTPDEFYVLRQKGTERAFAGEYNDHKEPGTYLCRACGNALFDSDTKFDSGSGWPSFFAPLTEDSVCNIVLVRQRVPGWKDAGSFAKKCFQIIGVFVQISLPGQHDEQCFGAASCQSG